MQNDQLTSYIQQCFAQGMRPDDIRAALIRSGWSAAAADAALGLPQAAPPISQPGASGDPHRVRKGILWILSPYILFVLIALLQFVVKFALNTGAGTDVELDSEVSSSATTGSLVAVLINIFSILAGMVALVLIPVGFIIGIIKITKK